MASAPPPPSCAGPPGDRPPDGGTAPAASPSPDSGSDPILCAHCGRTARNGITCQGICVADSGY